eukprot:scaffold373366_cov16-Prasinocladus_malaysianus.AAC.1
MATVSSIAIDCGQSIHKKIGCCKGLTDVCVRKNLGLWPNYPSFPATQSLFPTFPVAVKQSEAGPCSSTNTFHGCEVLKDACWSPTV